MKIVAFSDTHASEHQVKLPEGDVLVFAGDFSGMSTEQDVIRFNAWLGKQMHPRKIIIAGNHDRFCEQSSVLANLLLSNADYLEDSEITIDGVRFYGTPYTPMFNNWSFMREEEELEKIYNKIPNGIDVLISHGPPDTILDDCKGSWALLDAVNRVKPKIHIFGHIHGGYGIYQRSEHSTTFINASLLNDSYELVNLPIVKEICIDRV